MLRIWAAEVAQPEITKFVLFVLTATAATSTVTITCLCATSAGAASASLDLQTGCSSVQRSHAQIKTKKASLSATPPACWPSVRPSPFLLTSPDSAVTRALSLPFFFLVLSKISFTQSLELHLCTKRIAFTPRCLKAKVNRTAAGTVLSLAQVQFNLELDSQARSSFTQAAFFASQTRSEVLFAIDSKS